MSRAFLALDPELRLACGAVLLGVAAADGVIDDDELLPILGDLDLDTLPPDAVQRLASWVIHPPAVDGFASRLASQGSAVRFGLVARLLEIAGTDAFLAPGELERLTHAAHLLGVDDDQLGALRVFVS
ncbi:MAG: TerB family tellurite resistance protein, partial [Myxococcota bacterium]